MKKTLIALTTLVAATVGFQGQAQADYVNKYKSGVQLNVQLGNGLGFTIGDNIHKIHQSGKHRDHRKYRRDHRYNERRGYKKHHRYQDRHGYPRRHRCHLASKRSIKRSLRHRGFYDIHRVRRHGRIFSAKAISPRGHLVKLKVNRCNYRIVKHRIIRAFPRGWSQNNYYRTYW